MTYIRIFQKAKSKKHEFLEETIAIFADNICTDLHSKVEIIFWLPCFPLIFISSINYPITHCLKSCIPKLWVAVSSPLTGVASGKVQ